MSKSLVKSGSKLLILTFSSRILGLVREMIKAAFLGTSALSDAFSVAFVIPNLLRRLFAENSISVAFIPTFRKHLDSRTQSETKDFLSATFTLITCLTTLTVIAGIALTPLIVPIFGTTTSETILLTRIMFPYLAVISVAAFFQGILNGVKIFSPSGFTPILFNICIIAFTWFLSPYVANPARAMAIGVMVGGTIQALFQLPFVLRQGFRFSFVSIKKALSNPGTKTVLKLIGPTIIGMAAYQLNDLVSTILAGNAGPGVVSSLTYSLRLQELILGVFAVSIGTVILPDLSSHANDKNWIAFNGLLAKSMNIIALITIPLTFYSLVSAEGLISLVFKSRNFSDASVKLTLQAFLWHISGLYFIALNRIISPAFYAQSNTKDPTLAGILAFGVNIAIALILVGPMKGGGIALALSLASLSNTILLIFFMRKNSAFSVSQLLRTAVKYALKLTAFSIIAAAPILYFRKSLYAYFANHHKLISQGVPLGISLIVFGGIGIGLLLISRDTIALQVFSGLKKKIHDR